MIWVILKKSKNWREKEEERTLDTFCKKYIRAANTKYASKQNRDYNYIPDFYSIVDVIALELQHYPLFKM